MQRKEPFRQGARPQKAKCRQIDLISPNPRHTQFLDAGPMLHFEIRIDKMTQASTFEIIQMAAQKRVSLAAISKRALAAKATSIGPAHIRAALLFAARKAN
jgi:hypothetical protein